MQLLICIALLAFAVVRVECQCAAGQYDYGCSTGWNYLSSDPKCWTRLETNYKMRQTKWETNTGDLESDPLVNPCTSEYGAGVDLFDGDGSNYDAVKSSLDGLHGSGLCPGDYNSPYAYWIKQGERACYVLAAYRNGPFSCRNVVMETKYCTDSYYSICKKAVTCANCAKGKVSAANSACSNCYNGGVQANEGKTSCDSCGAGTYTSSADVQNWVCTPCNAGYYQKSGGQNNCNTQCAAGKVSTGGASACSNCYNGKYQDSTGQSVCKTCGAGKFATNINEPKSICADCTAGRVQASGGKNTCLDECSAGTYSLAGASACTGCPSYSYSPQASGTLASCICNAGYTGPDGGPCTACVPGKYKTSAGSADCTGCAPGRYSTETAATTASTCVPACAAGKYSLTAATVCLNCHNGQYQDETGKGECKSCLPGEFTRNDDTPKLACTHCLPGYYQPNDGKTTCITCDPGTYQTSSRQAVCTSCAAGMFSTTTAATHPDFCLKCMAGTYSLISAPSCTACIKGTYTPAAGRSACTLCVGEQAYAPNTGMTTCYQCSEKRQISDIFKTFCFACNDGEEEDRPNSRCVDCDIGKYSDGTTNRKCVPCRAGTYALSKKTVVCDKCKACPDSFYRAGCTITQGGGSCLECEKCTDPKTEVRVDCMNRAGHNDATGVCRKREFTVRNPYCDIQGSGYFLGGYTFNELFATSQDNADFQCRGICDGSTNRLTDAMKTESNLIQYRDQSFDSGYCKGPYACDVPTCVIYGVSDDSQPSFRLPAACPVLIDDALTERLWTATKQADYKQDPLYAAVQNMRYNVECQACSTCGEMPADVLKYWPLMQNYTDWGRGCARECTELSCKLGEIFDWTVADATSKCKKCSELEDVRLCTSKQQQGFSASDISGNMPKLTFKDCQPKRIVQFGIARASYGDCLRCPETTDACGAGFYYKTCDQDLKPTCDKCDSRATASSSYFNGNASNPLYCQRTLCPDDRTGVTVDVTPHRICHRQCSTAKCASDRVELPCLLPHDKRCKASMTYADFPADELYKKQGYVPAHANVLERVSGLHLYASFENVLLSVESIPLQRRRVCVWNANGIRDNDMNPAGISVRFEEACRPWTRDPDISYPLLPMQNTVTDSTAFQRRILLNTSAVAMHYLSEWHRVARIPNVFTGDVFLDLELTNASHTAAVAFASPDRLLSNVTSVVRWHVSVYAQQTVGLRDDVLLHIETPDDVQHCDECFRLQVACVPPSCPRATSTSDASLACSTAPHSASRTSLVAAAWQDFCGDKFQVSVPKEGVYVCGEDMQRRVVPAYTPSHAALAVLAGELDAACAQGSVFSVQLANPQVLLGGTEALPGKFCLGFVFSNTSVFCLSVLGGMHAVSDSGLHPDAFTIRSVVVYRDSLITTVSTNLNQVTTSYVSNVASICATLSASVTGRVLNERATAFNHTRYPIFMLATGNPLYFLSRVESGAETSMMLRKYSCGNVLLMTSTFCESDAVPVQLFSGNLPSVQTHNTLLHARGDALLFVTSTHSPTAGTVVMAVLASSGAATRRSVALTTQARDVVYPNNGESHRISGCWIADGVYLLSLEDQQQLWRLTLNAADAFTLLPPAKSMFSYSFIALGGAVLAKTPAAYSLTSCMRGCTTSARDTTAYFAFGNPTLTYTRLLPCRDSHVSHVNPLELQQAPTQTCAVAEFNRDSYSMQYALSLQCKDAAGVVSASLTVEAGAVVRITSRDASTVLAGNASQLVFMYAQCVNANVAYVRVYDRFACGGGCTLYQVAQIQITGNVHLNYVLHSVLRPRDSMIYTLLRSSTYAPPRRPLAASFDSWTLHSAFTHSMADLQRVQVNLIRRTQELFALAEPTHVALDVLQVVPTLNLQAVLHVLPTNASALLTLVHIPSDDDLARLALGGTVRGSEISGWKRLHAAAFLRPAGGSLGCVFDLRLVAVDDRFVLRQASSKVGCRMRVQAEGAASVGRCHVEVPFAMANSAGVVGLLLQGTCELPPPDSLTVELTPFTSMSECAEHQYLDADTAKCASCELREAVCGAGFYAAGCEAMLWQGDLLACLPCPVPPRALFTNASGTCSDWLCEASFFRADSLCLNCSTSLRSVCAKTTGQMWTPCAALENEKCVDCPLSGLPRNAEWTNTSECAWKCQPSYFNNNGICEACLSLPILKSVLGIQGTRTPGAFYKFQPCTETRQAEFTTCQFERQLNVTYTGDAAEFLRDCPVRCAEYLHAVSTTVLDAQTATWKATQCIQCPLSAQPTYVNGSLVPRAGYDMDASCSATCSAEAEHYAVEGGGRCAYCPSGRCAAGQYPATEDGCESCRNCSSHLQGAFVFEREGLVDSNTSCHEVCAPGYYLADDGVECLPHTDVRCVPKQFKVNGTARTDARCDECTDCTGYRQVSACSRTQDANCESCGPLVWWSSFWNGTECDLACKSAYTKLYAPKTRCQRCSACPNGFQRVPGPANCSDCAACTPPKPEHAEYISQCAWKCEKYHILRLNDATGMPQCAYSVDWSTNVPAAPARRQYNVSCYKGQTLTDDLLCADCAAPPGLNQSKLNVAWAWTGVGCAWQCVSGRMHVMNATAQQSSCLTRAEYLALVVSRPVHPVPSLKSFNYMILLLVVVPLTFVLVSCGLR